jgi:hypothetical protein
MKDSNDMICRSSSPKRARARAHLVAAERIFIRTRPPPDGLLIMEGAEVCTSTTSDKPAASARNLHTLPTSHL